MHTYIRETQEPAWAANASRIAFLYVCMYVRMYVCMYVAFLIGKMYVFIYVCMAYMCLAFLFVYMHVCIHEWMGG